MTQVLCLRPQADFARVDALAPASLSVSYHAPGDAEVPALMRKAKALVIPAVGPKLAPALPSFWRRRARPTSSCTISERATFLMRALR